MLLFFMSQNSISYLINIHLIYFYGVSQSHSEIQLNLTKDAFIWVVHIDEKGHYYVNNSKYYSIIIYYEMDTGTNDNQKFGHIFGTGYFEIKIYQNDGNCLSNFDIIF